MNRTAKSTTVLRAYEGIYRDVTALTDRFCEKHLNDEYARLARFAIAALCRKRPSPLVTGALETWACAVVYALGQVNFLSDKSRDPCMTMHQLCARFGVADSTAANKAKRVRDALGMRHWDHRWILPSRHDSTMAMWLVEVNGIAVDARWLPRPLQEAAFKRGLIPYIPADHGRATVHETGETSGD